jgi:O-antigen/teichoic acid export membrane protein
MSYLFKILVLAAIMGALIIMLLMFGFSDFYNMSPEHYEIIQAKPWRPYARVAMAFILISMICILGGAFIRSIFRGNNE